MTGVRRPSPTLPPSIQIGEIKKFAQSLNTTIPISDSTLYKRIKGNTTWATVYLWFCESARTNPKGQAKVSCPELIKAMPQLSKTQAYYFCHYMIYLGYFKRTEGIKWETDFESIKNFVFSEFVEEAEQKLNIKNDTHPANEAGI